MQLLKEENGRLTQISSNMTGSPPATAAPVHRDTQEQGEHPFMADEGNGLKELWQEAVQLDKDYEKLQQAVQDG